MRNFSIDKMKFACIVAVVCIHARPFSNNNLGWIINSICRFAVPFFFATTGYLFYSKFSSKHAKSYFIKILKLLICWTIFYILFRLIITSLSNISNNKSLFEGYGKYFYDVTFGDIYYSRKIVTYHLWYLNSTLFIIPILYLVAKYNLVNISLYVGLVLNVVGIILTALGHGGVTRDAIFFAFFYCVLGMYIRNNEKSLKVRLANYKLYMFAIVVLLFTPVIERYIFRITFDYYISSIPLTFLLLYMCVVKPSYKETLVSKIGANSIGVYLTHIAVIEILDLFIVKLDVSHIKNYLIYNLTIVPIVIVISYMSYRLIQRIKVLCYKNKNINNIVISQHIT